MFMMINVGDNFDMLASITLSTISLPPTGSQMKMKLEQYQISSSRYNQINKEVIKILFLLIEGTAICPSHVDRCVDMFTLQHGDTIFATPGSGNR